MDGVVSDVFFDFWALPRPMTKRWGNGIRFWERLCDAFQEPDVVFGKTDGIPDDVLAVDHNTGFEWRALPFEDNQFEFGYWDPPYDKLYKPEGQEIWRIVKRLAVLHWSIYPTSWFDEARRTGMIACTMGPLKRIRCLQIFYKSNVLDDLPLFSSRIQCAN